MAEYISSEALIGKAQRFREGRWASKKNKVRLSGLKAIKPGCGVLFERLQGQSLEWHPNQSQQPTNFLLESI